jgi:hypothetical protein
MKILRVVCVVLALTASIAFAASDQVWKTQKECESGTHLKCVSKNSKGWQPLNETPSAATAVSPAVTGGTAQENPSAPVSAVAAPVEPSTGTQPAIEPPPAPPKSTSWHLWGLLGGEDNAKTPASTVIQPAATPQPVSAPVTTAPIAPSSSPMPSAATPSAALPKPEKVDPELALRGRIWTSESACKKEALKGTCTPMDCATHTGGACSGYTSMIWLYR